MGIECRRWSSPCGPRVATRFERTEGCDDHNDRVLSQLAERDDRI
jgi:hypothetical protein